MKPFVALAAVLSLFFVGVIVGALGGHLYHAKHLRHPGGPQEMIAHGFESQLVRELELTSEQITAIHEILSEGHEQTQRLREELEPQVHAHMRRMHEQIDEILSPEQRKRFAELRALHRRQADTFFLGPRHAPGHGAGHGMRLPRH